MTNSIAACANRQHPKAFVRKFTLAEFLAASTANTLKIAMPIGAVITGGSVTTVTASNIGSSPTDLLDVGYSGALEAYKADINLEATAGTRVALVPTGYVHTSSTPDLILTRTPSTADATALEILVEFTYVQLDSGDFTQD